MDGKSFVAEFVGTFTLVFVGVGAIAMAGDGSAGLLAVALAHGLALVVMISAVAAVSGGHLNPAVSFGLWLAGKLPLGGLIGYVIAQVLGALAATAMILAALPEQVRAVSLGSPALAPGVGVGSAIVLEAVLTFFLVFTVYGTAVDRRAPRVGGLFIGLSVTMGILVAGPLTGGALNPARHLGPALLAGGDFLAQAWLYWVGPLIGGALAALVYRGVLEEPPTPSPHLN